MAIIGLLLMAVGGIAAFVGGIWFLIVTFSEGVGWGLACLFIPFVALFFLVKFWEDAKNPFLTQVGGLLVMFLGALLGGGASTAGP